MSPAVATHHIARKSYLRAKVCCGKNIARNCTENKPRLGLSLDRLDVLGQICNLDRDTSGSLVTTVQVHDELRGYHT